MYLTEDCKVICVRTHGRVFFNVTIYKRIHLGRGLFNRQGKAMSEEEKATDRWENEGGHGRKRIPQNQRRKEQQ